MFRFSHSTNHNFNEYKKFKELKNQVQQLPDQIQTQLANNNPEKSQKNKKIAFWIILMLGIVFIGAGCLGLYLNYAKTSHYEQTTAQVVRVNYYYNSARDAYENEVYVDYYVNSTHYSFVRLGSFSEEFSVGEIISIHYNINNHEDIIMLDSRHFISLFAIGAGVVLIIMAIIFKIKNRNKI